MLLDVTLAKNDVFFSDSLRAACLPWRLPANARAATTQFAFLDSGKYYFYLSPCQKNVKDVKTCTLCEIC
jgi:hypothetical protein